MILVPLGTNGFFPSYGRGTMSFLVQDGDRALLLDAGSGLGRLVEPPIAERLATVATLDIVLTHYHLDHVIGLSYLPGVWRGRHARIWAPAPPLVEGDPEQGLGRLLAPPLFPHTAGDWPLDLEIHRYTDVADLAPLGWDLRLRPQHHPGGSVGLRLGDRLAYITDTISDPDTIPFVAGVRLLLHEVWWEDAELAAAPNPSGHASVSAVANIAHQAGVGALAPIHHQPKRTSHDLARMRSALADQAPGLPVVELIEGRPVELG